MSSTELIDVVDENDNIIATMPRNEAHAKFMNVRIAAALVFNSDGEIILSQNAAHKNVDPLLWSYSAAGHVSAGESYDVSVLREASEEIGVNSDKAEYLGLIRLTHPQTGKLGAFHRIYKIISDGPYIPQEEEIADVKAFELNQLNSEIKQHPEQFSRYLKEAIKLIK